MKRQSIPPSGGGLTLLDKTPVLSAPTGAHQSTTVITITGAGILEGIWSGAGTTATVAIQVDGGTIYTMSHDLNTTTPVVMVPFKTSLKITASSATGLRISYSLA